MSTQPHGLDFGSMSDLFHDAEREKELNETIDRLTRRVRELEDRAQALVDLASDPEHAHRMITRREILRTLRGD